MQRFVRAALVLCAMLFLPAAAHAQLFRAYLASYGNDANPCTVGQPCRLLPAALNAVANNGEIWILDSANFNAGTVTITKSVSIRAVPGQVGSFVAAAGGAALVVSNNATVSLRNIAISGNAVNPGTAGIVADASVTLALDEMVFERLVGYGIDAHGGYAVIEVRNSVFRNIQNYAIYMLNGPNVSVVHCSFKGTSGILASSTTTGTALTVTDSTVTDGSVGIAVTASGSTASTRAVVTRSVIHNTLYGLESSASGGGSSNLSVSYSTVTENGWGYYQSGTGAVIRSLGNNDFSFNTGAGSLTPASLQ